MRTKKHTSVVTWIVTSALLISMCATFTFGPRTIAQSIERKPTGQREWPSQNADYRVISRYATDLTRLALSGKLELPRGYDSSVARVIASLSTAKAPVILAESDLDRDAIARGVALRVASGDVPQTLRDKRVFSLSLDAVAKSARTSEEFESRVQAIFAEAAKTDRQIIHPTKHQTSKLVV